MENKIVDGMSLGQMEKILASEIVGKEYWGELDISFEEYTVVKERIKVILQNRSLDFIFQHYPHTITTVVVFLIVYKYNTNFWGLLAEELEISVENSSEIGKRVLKVFKQCGMNYDDVKDDPRKYVAPIIYEAGLPPESSLKDLFYILNYDLFGGFDPQLFLEELLAMRAYQLRKPMIHFLQRFRNDKAIDFILMIRDAMLSVEQKMSSGSRYVDHYAQWKAEQKSHEVANGKKTLEIIARPYLFFDNGRRGLSIILPRYELEHEWIEDIKWTIEGKHGFSKTIHCKVYGDQGRRYIESAMIAVSPDDHYNITMVDGEGIEQNELGKWDVEGVPEDGILLFNSKGKRVHNNNLQYPYTIMISKDDITLDMDDSMVIEEQVYPTDVNGYISYCLLPTSSRAYVSISTDKYKIVLSSKPQIMLSLEGRTLFNLGDYSEETDCYVEFPKVLIKLEDIIDRRGLEVRVRDRVIPIDHEITDDIVELDLKALFHGQTESFGTYTIRLYQLNHFLKQVEFHYVPEIDTTYTPVLKWQEKEKRKQNKEYRFGKLADWELIFSDCIYLTEEYSYLVKCAPDVGVIEGTLRSKIDDLNFSCSFKLPVNPVDINVLNIGTAETENVVAKCLRLGLEDINDDYWISMRFHGSYRNDEYSLILKNGNGNEQCVQLKITQNGCANKGLGLFEDTLRNCVLPAQIVLSCNKNRDYELPLISIYETVELKVRPKYLTEKQYLVLSIKDDEKDITLRRFGTDIIEHELAYANSKLNASQTARGYKCKYPLPEGIYSVTGNKTNGFMLMEEEEVQISDGTGTLYIEGTDRDQFGTFSFLLSELIEDILKYKKGIEEKDSYLKIKKMVNLKSEKLRSHDIENLIALAYFTNSKMLESKKNQIRECMYKISETVLDDRSRMEMIRALIKMNVSQIIFDICVQNYALLLVNSASEDLSTLADEVVNYSVPLSLLLKMQADATIKETLSREKYTELIGKEAIKYMICFPEDSSKEEQKRELIKFRKEEKGSHITIHIGADISGEMKPIENMIDYDRKVPFFNKEKKPEIGIYFGNIRYVDQYVNWYSMNHLNNGMIKDTLKNAMVKIVTHTVKDIYKCVQRLKKDTNIGEVVKQYDAALMARCPGGIDLYSIVNQYPRYFYLQGIAALLCKLPSERIDLETERRLGNMFMTQAFKIAPRMAQRDLLMAETYLYLKRKEEKLCQ